jgi:hypothetical protein
MPTSEATNTKQFTRKEITGLHPIFEWKPPYDEHYLQFEKYKFLP